MIAALLSLLALTGTLLALPLTPAMRELLSRRDAHALPIQAETEHITDLATGFRASLLGRTGSRPATTLVLEKDVVLDAGLFFPDHIYAKNNLSSQGRNVFAAILCEKDFCLGESSRLLRWLHAEGMITIQPGCILGGRVSAGQRIVLGAGCKFERVHAPTIVSAGLDTPGIEVPQPDEPVVGERVTNRIVVKKDFTLRPGEFLRSNVVAGRRIQLAEGTQVVGSLKSKAAMELDSGVLIQGSLVSASDLRIGPAGFVLGPVLAERELVIGSGTHIGTPDHLTTVSAPRIRIAPGAHIHGTLWAREEGLVEG